MHNIKNSWKDIKYIIIMKNLSSCISKSLSSNGSTVINQLKNSNVLNSYLVTIISLISQKKPPNLLFSKSCH